MLDTGDRFTALSALALLVPAASIGSLAALSVTGSWGQPLSALCQVWLLVFPIAWSVLVDRQKLHLSLPKRRELLAGAIWGIFMFAVIVGIYSLFGQHWIDPVAAKQKAQQLGINSHNIYLIIEAYFVLINSLIEEFTWRWFVCNKCQILIPGKPAIFLSSLLFTLHHILVIAAYSDWRAVILGSFAVWGAGIIWSQCYLTYRSLWPSYISHAIADLALAIIAWQILFN
ncbi:CPBP family intramembrane glutamic endopeptidase [Microcoleus sp. bin38.metabat.b11b12b14.051]|uniref:CPBP family intramembrane glutamic endopeptidase n=1 Tax=Microcoleus sp. bin38.metabat.b11b12b14.051 TaxID=2742709 RepID=UPI0025D28673|nr:CPBP family intramembrane glutamic endopeptidase [Microcoleus sp. bin38.metabat.b11b12b14.051]